MKVILETNVKQSTYCHNCKYFIRDYTLGDEWVEYLCDYNDGEFQFTIDTDFVISCEGKEINEDNKLEE